LLTVPSPLDDIQAVVGAAFHDIFYAATLTRDIYPSSPAYDPFDPPVASLVTKKYSCRALRTDYRDRHRMSTENRQEHNLIDEKDRKVLITASSLEVVPIKGDRVEVKGEVFTLVEINIDPANAVWVCRGRLA
jgi:hypothetical protein